MMARVFWFFAFVYIIYISSTTFSSCAVMVPPSGGTRDSIAPKLVRSNPINKAVDVKTKSIVLEFDEFVETEDAYNRIIISPAMQAPPEVRHKLKTVTIKLNDSLLSNTTYKISINGAIKDVNEGNKLNDLDLLFSTGKTIDSNSISGTVLLAETGKVDSTLIVGLYTNTTDSAVAKEVPKYIAKLNGSGTFTFTNLPNTKFAVYAMSNESGQKKYTTPTQQFAFIDSLINTKNNPSNIKLFSYIHEKDKPKPPADKISETKLRYNTSLQGNNQDVLLPITISTNKKIASFDSTKIYLTDTLFQKKYKTSITLDSNKKEVVLRNNWTLGTAYKLIVEKEALKDEKGTTINKTDTISFTTNTAKDYGKAIIRFNEVNFKNNPVILIVKGDNIMQALPITTLKITIPLLNPGDYELRILYDSNKNRLWDTGSFFEKKQQPEKVKALSQKLQIKADWDNELEITEAL